MTDHSRLWAAIFVVALLIAYSLPFLQTPAASLSMSGYDLAEWTSLIPVVRAETPSMLTTLALRFPLAAIALLPIFAMRWRRFSTGWWLAAIFALILTVAQLPPLEFVTIARGDPNYQQQFMMALLMLAGAIVGLFVEFRLRPYVAVALTVLAAVASLWGGLRALTLMEDFRLRATLGVGATLAAALFALYALILVLRANKDLTQGPKDAKTQRRNDF